MSERDKIIGEIKKNMLALLPYYKSGLKIFITAAKSEEDFNRVKMEITETV